MEGPVMVEPDKSDRVRRWCCRRPNKESVFDSGAEMSSPSKLTLLNDPCSGSRRDSGVEWEILSKAEPFELEKEDPAVIDVLVAS
mmetsp:Transcript_1781/g.2406  ORF Transcript_1781/g.2406 Transcript_1781/m.2406 type:complete len:85 (+) Transcript_1781:426-680(+)